MKADRRATVNDIERFNHAKRVIENGGELERDTCRFLIEQLEAAQRERDAWIEKSRANTLLYAAMKTRAELAEAELKRRDAQEPVAFTEKHEISNMHATGLYIRAWPADRERNAIEGYTIPLYAAAPAEAPEKVVKLPEAYTVESVWGQVHYDCNENGDNYDTESIHEALDAAGVKYEVKK